MANTTEQALKALKAAQQFITNGVSLGFIRMPDADTPDSAHYTPLLIADAIRAITTASAEAAMPVVDDLLTIPKSELIRTDDYGVHGSTFYACRLCEKESSAGILNKAIEALNRMKTKSNHWTVDDFQFEAGKVIEAITAASAEAAAPDELRRAVRAMTDSLNNREWAEHVSTDEDAQALESAITDLIGRAAPQACKPIGQPELLTPMLLLNAALIVEGGEFAATVSAEKRASIAEKLGRCAEQLRAASNSQPVSGAVTDEQIVDEVVTGLYRRFKDWSKRGFGPDDVTWCEVKADVVALLSASGQAVSEQLERLKYRKRELETEVSDLRNTLNALRARQTEAPVNVPSEEQLFDWLQRKYVQSADARQKEMGLVYMTAETHDLAKELAKFIAAAPAPVQTEAQQSIEKDAERWQTVRSMLNAGPEVEAMIEKVLHQVFPANEERKPTPDELDAVIDGVAAAIAQEKAK